MRALWIALTLVAALALGAGARAEDVREVPVHFKPGTSSATIKGSVTGYAAIDYVLGAKAGQTMTVEMQTDNGANSFNVQAPGGEAAIGSGETSNNAWSGPLPVDGEYRVRVYLMRSAARRNETGHYTLTVGIAGANAKAGADADAGAAMGQAPASDAKVAGTPYHATGTVPCSVGPDPKGSAQCSFGVIRGASGNAEVRLAPVGYDVVLHPDKVETVLIFHGDSVKSAKASDKLTATKQGDEWSIGVNEFLFYSIPDVVIVGG
jgi:hypothetical protein